MAHNPLTLEDIQAAAKNQNFPARRILATNPSTPSAFGYYDVDTYGFGAPQIDVINLELKLTSVLNRFKELTYDVSGNLTNMKIWNSSAKTIQYFNIDFNYTGDNLTNIETTRISDSYVYNKNLTYDVNNNLTEIEII